jgi:hypothetical protein
MLEIVIEKKNGKEKRERERERVFKSCFLDAFLYKTPPSSFFLFLDFLANKKLHKNPPVDNPIVHNKTLNLQTKFLTQILKIEKDCNNIISLQRKWERKKNQEMQIIVTIKL